MFLARSGKHTTVRFTEDGTGRSNPNTREFWELVKNDPGYNRILVVGRECFCQVDENTNIVGFNNQEFRIKKDGEEISSRIFHIGSIPDFMLNEFQQNASFM